MVFQASETAVYVIETELPVPPGVRVTGLGGRSQTAVGQLPTLRQAPGTSLKCIMASAGYLAGLYATTQFNNGTPKRDADPAIEIDHVAFDGQNGGAAGGGNNQGHGVVLYSIESKVHDCYFLNIAESAVVVADCNYAQLNCLTQTFENRVVDNQIINPGKHGIWVTQTHGAIGATDGYLVGNSVVSASLQEASAGPNINPTTRRPYEGIRMDNSAGWWVVNNSVSNSPGDAWYLNTTWGVHLSQNTAFAFGCHPLSQQTYTGFFIITAAAGGRQRNAHHGFINGNLASAYEGFNAIESRAPNDTNQYVYFSVSMQIEPYDISASFEQSNNVAWQASQPPAAINSATVTSGSNAVLVAKGAAAGIQPGMSVQDTQGLIPSTATVKAVKPGTSTGHDRIILSTNATGSSTVDELTFPGPTTTAWLYVNNNTSALNSIVNVYRTNEVVTGTVNAVPSIAGAAEVKIIDPANIVGGVTVGGTPTKSQVIVATSSTTAAWATLTASGPVFSPAIIASSGTYTIASGTSSTSKLRITCVAGGGGGGGGGSNIRPAVTQAGGSGGAAGTTSIQVVEVGPNEALNVTIGSGGGGGAGGAAGGNNPGAQGATGGDTTVTGRGIAVRASGGPGGFGSPGGSANAPSGVPYGGQPGTTTPFVSAGCGAGSGDIGGAPNSHSAGGGGGGGSASLTRGGTGGGAGSTSSGGAAGTTGGNAKAVGTPGDDAQGSGGGGGGGGGGTAGAAGGTGGAGAPGFVIISLVDLA